mmetsp:Transcript_4480/g.7686  ORF Transcript_4480/g.7686 Transcript_4480/m.7686 type:complete len:322 (+) Transcript_4480:2303-3268(+)
MQICLCQGKWLVSDAIGEIQLEQQRIREYIYKQSKTDCEQANAMDKPMIIPLILFLARVALGDYVFVTAMQWNPNYLCFKNNTCEHGAVDFLERVLKRNVGFVGLTMWESKVLPLGHIRHAFPNISFIENNDCGYDTQALLYNNRNWVPVDNTPTAFCLDDNDRGAIVQTFKPHNSSNKKDWLTVFAADFSHNTTKSFEMFDAAKKKFPSKLNFTNLPRLLLIADTKLTKATNDTYLFKRIGAPGANIHSSAQNNIDPATCCVNNEQPDLAYSRIVMNSDNTHSTNFGFNHQDTWEAEPWAGTTKNVQLPIFLFDSYKVAS